MTKRPNPTIIITALCTSCALLAFARYKASVPFPPVALFVTAAVICLLPVVYKVLRSVKSC